MAGTCGADAGAAGAAVTCSSVVFAFLSATSTTPFKASTSLLGAVAGFGAGVIFLRAATNAAATWRVAAVLVLFVFVVLVGATSAAFFLVGISAFRAVSTAPCAGAAVLDFEVSDFEVSDFDAGVPAGDRGCVGDATALAAWRVPTFCGDASAFDGLADTAFARAEDDASLPTGTLAAAEDLLAAFAADARDEDVADTALPSATGLMAAALLKAGLPESALREVGLAAAGSTTADATFFTVAACFAAAAGFDLARPSPAFIAECDSGFEARAVDFTAFCLAAFWPRTEVPRPTLLGSSLAAEDASLAFRLREATAAFDFGGIGNLLLIDHLTTSGVPAASG